LGPDFSTGFLFVTSILAGCRRYELSEVAGLDLCRLQRRDETEFDAKTIAK